MQDHLIKQYSQLHQKSPGYGHSFRHAPFIRNSCRENRWKTVLDFGCGKGALTDKLRELGINAMGYDPAVEGRNNIAWLDRTYDMVAAIDVMEHCPPGTIKPELRGIRDLAKEGVLLLISCRPAHAKTPDGKNAHLSIHPPEWWMDRINEVFPRSWTVELEEYEPNNKALTVFLRREGKMKHIENMEILSKDHIENFKNPSLDQKYKIAVVGNGPVGPEDTKRIEESDYVIRFNDFNRRKNSSKNSTDRCDLLFTQFDIREMEDTPPPNTVCIAIPSPFHQDRVIEKADEWYWRSRIAMFNPYSMRMICKELNLRDSDGSEHPIPTVGFQMLWQLERWVKASQHEVFVTGFTWHVDIEAKTAARMDLLGDEMPITFNHSYLREVKWCSGNLIENKAFSFGAKAKEALYFVRWLTQDQPFEKNYHKTPQGDWRYDPEQWGDMASSLGHIREQLNPQKDDFIIDIGCGPRTMCELFVQRDWLTVIDPLADEYAAMAKPHEGLVADVIISAPAEEYDESGCDSYNIVWCHNALDHCHDWKSVLRNIWRYLKKGGRAYIGTDCHPPRLGHLGIDYKELVLEIGALGFTGVIEKKKEKGGNRWIREYTFILTK